MDTLMPGVALSCVLPSYLRSIHQLVGLLIPSIRESVRGFDEIRAAGKYWVKVRMEKMQGKSVDRSDLLDKFFKIHTEKEAFGIPDIQNESCVAM
jgi:hypothetical protein